MPRARLRGNRDARRVTCQVGLPREQLAPSSSHLLKQRRKVTLGGCAGSEVPAEAEHGALVKLRKRSGRSWSQRVPLASWGVALAAGARRNRTWRLAAGRGAGGSFLSRCGSPPAPAGEQLARPKAGRRRQRRDGGSPRVPLAAWELRGPQCPHLERGEQSSPLPCKAIEYCAHRKLLTELLILFPELGHDQKNACGSGGRQPGRARGALKSAWNVCPPAWSFYFGAPCGRGLRPCRRLGGGPGPGCVRRPAEAGAPAPRAPSASPARRAPGLRLRILLGGVDTRWG